MKESQPREEVHRAEFRRGPNVAFLVVLSPWVRGYDVRK